MNRELSESQMLQMLQESDCEVTFKKVNGDLRVMPCTLRPEALPPKVITEDRPVKERAKLPGVISVWCLDRKEWRSFRTANVVSILKI
jgi:hypothetical protein